MKTKRQITKIDEAKCDGCGNCVTGCHEGALQVIGGKALVIACTKLDDGREIYVEKVQALIENAKINTLTVVTMEVPCRNGLLAIVKEAAAAANRKVPVKHVVISIQGGIKNEEWV